MAKGPKLHLKRLHAPKNWHLAKMGGVFATRPAPGPHRARECLPLLVFVRNFLGYANNADEAIKIIERGHFVINGKTHTSPKFPVGLMDVVFVPALNRTFRLIYNANGRWTTASQFFDPNSVNEPLPVDLVEKQKKEFEVEKTSEEPAQGVQLKNSFETAPVSETAVDAPKDEANVYLLPCKVRARKIGYKKMVGFNRAAETAKDRNIPWLSTECGRTIRFVDKRIVAGDTVVLKVCSTVNEKGEHAVAEQDVAQHIPFQEGKVAMVVRGKNVGRVGRVRLVEKHVRLSDVVYLEDERNNKFVTKKENVMVIGEDLSVIGLAKDRGVRMNLEQKVKWSLANQESALN